MDKNKNKFPIYNLSFTLIEILITISIILLFFGLSLSSYNQLSQEQKLKEEGQKLANILGLAKQKSFAADKSNQNCNDFSGYQIYFINQNQCALRLCCNSSCSLPINIQTYSISSTLISPSSNSYIWFKPLGSEVKFSSGNPFTITIKNININKCITIDVSRFGLINFNDSLISC